jgi:hypothetical protein
VTLSVLVPYRPDDGHRDRAWAWNKRRWEALGAELVVHSPADGATPADFNHPYAINRAAEQAHGDVFLIADADTSFDFEWVHKAHSKVRSGQAKWILPRFYDQTTESAAEGILSGDPTQPIGEYECEWRGDSVSWSGLVVVPREAFELVGGYDERWEKWGGDDVAFTCSLKALWGACSRLAGRAIHLWHPRAHLDNQPQEQHDLMYRYLDAEGDPEAMRALIAERP